MFPDLVESISGGYELVRTTQRYISKELTHFVGRGRSASSQYKLLVRILRTGWLTHPPHDPHVSGNLTVTPSARISQNEMYSPQTVCFCDIPVEDLPLHARKYSRFGLSFDKDFIVENGGAPVHYIPTKSSVRVLLDLSPQQWMEYLKTKSTEGFYQYIGRGEYFDNEVRQYHKLLTLFHRLIFEALDIKRASGRGTRGDSVWDLPPDSEGFPIFDFPRQALKQIPSDSVRGLVQDAIQWDRRLSQLQVFLDFQVFSYVKFFDHVLPDDHKYNYYFEREWRVLGNVGFRIEDVKRVLIPEKYARQLREDCPQYYGQLTFLE